MTTTIAVNEAASFVAPQAVEASPISWTATELVLFSLAAGIAARGLWLMVGAWVIAAVIMSLNIYLLVQTVGGWITGA